MFSDAKLLAIADSYGKANSIRRPPAVTPAIVQGVLPQVLSRVIEFNEGNVQFEGVMEIDLLKNEMRYSLAVAPDSKAIYAVTLVRAPAQGGVRFSQRWSICCHRSVPMCPESFI